MQGECVACLRVARSCLLGEDVVFKKLLVSVSAGLQSATVVGVVLSRFFVTVPLVFENGDRGRRLCSGDSW